MNLVNRKFLISVHGVVGLAKRKIGVACTRFSDRAGTSTEKRFTRLIGKNASQVAVNLGKRKLG